MLFGFLPFALLCFVALQVYPKGSYSPTENAAPTMA